MSRAALGSLLVAVKGNANQSLSMTPTKHFIWYFSKNLRLNNK